MRTPRPATRAVLAVEVLLVLATAPVAGVLVGVLGGPFGATPADAALPVGVPLTATVVYLAPHHPHDVGLDLGDGRDPVLLRLLQGRASDLSVGEALRGTVVEVCRRDGTREPTFLELS